MKVSKNDLSAFVYDDEPINWGKRVFKILTPSQIINLANRELKVDSSVLLKPRGIIARLLRHKAIKLLLEKYNLKSSQVAQVFGISRMAVLKIVNKIQ